MHHLNFEKSKVFIKKAMKVKKITYKILATKLGLSESGVKKIFISNDCSFNRMMDICNILKIDIADICAASNSKNVRQLQLTRDQESFFRNHLDYFYIFWKLVYEGLSLNDIKKIFSLSDKDMFQYLKKLDDLGLIELHPDNEVHLPEECNVHFSNESTFLKDLITEWSCNLVHETRKKKDPYHTNRFLIYLVKKESLHELNEKIAELTNAFYKKSKEDGQFYNDLIPVRLLAVMCSGSPIQNISQKQLKNIF
ncbi:MAG: hypothetical protein A2381_00535 [Bdellovibrionales bacterium RIFOXYB1_FULL_37_110]|nr:MAG: hypothetical protein A2417_11590 [Bdellovibrionales bacterium RIFOXYC1_FULL_37_79]OFZ60879.1 MAG: hypothetical protein A2381_00535 [Bdellovibrionales bacterium RIFOXYB1_FULL_37_110]OFZ62409.1 MAG: hypothetical protein A2577_03200 [Bdellovibrionales bacterium RIFOXYD1_FULL_36_51]